MSFREKSAWACLVTMIAVYVPYFLNLFRLFEQRELDAASVLGAFIGAVVLQVVVLVAVHIALAIHSREERKDERDLAIESKSLKNAYSVLSVTSVLVIGGIILLAVVPSPRTTGHLLSPVFLSQLFLLCFVVSEATKYLTQAVSYRLGS